MGKSRSKSRGKKKGKKKDLLTDEEKRKQAEQRALAEREKLVARQSLTKAFLKVKQDKEYELVRVNQNKILDLWRPHLRKQKIKELLEQFQEMRDAFEKAFAKKSQWIEDLDRSVNGNEGDYAEATDGHLYQVDKMMEFYEMRLKEVLRMYEEAKEELYLTLNFERQRLAAVHSENMNSLRKGMRDLGESVAKADKEARAEQYAKLVELRTKGNHELYLFRSIMTEKVNKIWSDLHLKVLGYVNMNADKKTELIDLLAKDEEMAKTIEDLFKRRAVLVEGIGQLRKKRQLFEEAFDLYMFNIRQVRDSCRLAYNQLAQKRRKTLATTQAALRDLLLTVHDVHQELSELVSKREKVVVLVGRIVETETGSERVDPFLERWGLGGTALQEWKAQVQDASDFSAQQRGLNRFSLAVSDVVHRFDCRCSKCECESTDDPEGSGLIAPINSMVKTYEKLELFWIRFNKVGLEKAALQHQRQLVLRDNRDLKTCVRQYMSHMNPPSLLAAYPFPPPPPEAIEESTERLGELRQRNKLNQLRRNCSQLRMDTLQ